MDVEGAGTFHVPGDEYDRFMGRYSRLLAPEFADAAGIATGARVLDVGSGPGALTTELVRRGGASHVCAVDPSPPFVADNAARNPGVDVQLGQAEALPFEDAAFDVVMAQLVLHFTSQPEVAAREMRRVARPGGAVAACVWDFEEGMQMLRLFWDAALELDPQAPDEAQSMRFGRPGEIVELFLGAGLVDATETSLRVASTYDDFGELWSGLLGGIGPAGAYLTAQSEDRRAELRAGLFRHLGEPDGGFTLDAVARAAVARVP